MKQLERVKEVKGVGPSTLKRLLNRLGGEEQLVKALEDGNVNLLSSVDRISPGIAVRMILAYRGEEVNFITGNPAMTEIMDNVVNLLKERMNTDQARNRIDLIIPGGNLKLKEESSKRLHGLRNLIPGKDRGEIETLLSKLDVDIRSTRSKRTYPYVILAEDNRAMSRVSELGLDRCCMVGEPEDIDISAGDFLIYLYNQRELDEQRIPYIHSASTDSPVEEIIPDIILERWIQKLEILKRIARLQEIFDRGGVAAEVVDLLQDYSHIDGVTMQPEEIEEKILDIKGEAEAEMESQISRLTITGKDAVSLLSEERPEVLKDIYGRIDGEINSRMRERFGIAREVLKVKYPLELDREALERFISELREDRMQSMFQRRIRLASELVKLEKRIEEDMDWAYDLDFRYGLGSLIHDLDLNPFNASEGWLGIKNACHLHLRGGEDFQPITYHLGEVPVESRKSYPGSDVSNSRAALMTGANSGGKTTLLENIAQIVIMAYMGLPVPAEESHIPEIDRMLLYKPRRRMDAGGLETFLREILPLSLEVDDRTLVLADELEAMTELEAASRIIAGFVEELKRRNAYAVVVTHMAQGILEYLDVRTDGIEALGLDNQHRLIVDRTPRIGKQARSTPELILRSLMARSEGCERELYSSILEKFPRD